MRKTLLGIFGCLLLALWTASASAAGERTLTASCPSVSAEKVAGRWKKGNIVLSLPGFWDLTKVTLELEGSGTLYLGDQKTEIPAGVPSDLTGLTGQKLALCDDQGRRPANVTILQGSAVPSLFLEVDGEQLKAVNRSKEKSITSGRAVWTEADGTVSYDGGITQLKGRGNNSFLYSKKPYQLKLESKASLSGMAKGKTWILLAEWTDISLLRNRIVLDISKECGLRNALGCEHADVWINGNYQGLYLVTEKIQIGKDRIPIANLEKTAEQAAGGAQDPGELTAEKSETLPQLRYYPGIKDPEDITGGYILTIEKFHRMRDKPLAGFRTPDGLSIRIKEPTYPSRAQAMYLAGKVTELQHALMAQDGKSPETGKSYEEYLDTDSFALRFLIEDWCKNYDFMGGSQYLYKDSDQNDGRFYAGPSWDYDLSFGNMKDRGHAGGGAYLTSTRRTSNLYWLLDGQESFRAKVRELWKEAFRPAVSVLLGEAEPAGESRVRSLDRYAEMIRASAAMNYARWGLNNAASAREAGGGFDRSVEYLKKWISVRTAWMDETYGAETGRAE